VLADPILIEQVLLNLIKNGIEAMDQKTGAQHEESALKEKTLKVSVTHHQSTLEVAVTDAGHGVSDPNRLFEPFFSTKSEGLGMGLNICRTIIESHHGQLWAVNNAANADRGSGGTTFRFTLPCAPIDVRTEIKTTEEFAP
jgi:signal transduction histidine kinase